MDTSNEDLLITLTACSDELQISRTREREARERRDRECGRGPDEGWGEHDAPEPWLSWRRAANTLRIAHANYDRAALNCVERGRTL
jgi:hypothetical protein